MLHDKFLVVPIDKTSANVVFVCQRHYAKTLINKLGLNEANKST